MSDNNNDLLKLKTLFDITELIKANVMVHKKRVNLATE